MSVKSSFFAELKRRNVYKVAVAYAIVGWLLVQIATQVFPFLEIPNWIVRLVIALVAIGFPIALVIALREHPNDFRSLRALSWVYLALDRKTDALNIARHALDLLPPEKDAVLGSGNLAALAEIQAQTGAATETVQNLKKLLSIPAGETISITRLKIEPVWDPIRNDPGFQEILTMKEYVGP